MTRPSSSAREEKPQGKQPSPEEKLAEDALDEAFNLQPILKQRYRCLPVEEFEAQRSLILKLRERLWNTHDFVDVKGRPCWCRDSNRIGINRPGFKHYTVCDENAATIREADSLLAPAGENK